jgi:naphthoate synthase
MTDSAGQALALPTPRRSLRQLGSGDPFTSRTLKTACSGRHTGVAGQARFGDDLLLTAYRSTQEAEALSRSFEERRGPDRTAFHR